MAIGRGVGSGVKSIETQMLITNLSLPFSSPLSLNVSVYSSWLLFWSLDNWLNEPENFIRFHINNNINHVVHTSVALCVFLIPPCFSYKEIIFQIHEG